MAHVAQPSVLPMFLSPCEYTSSIPSVAQAEQKKSLRKKNVERGARKVLFEHSARGAQAAHRCHSKSSAWRGNINFFFDLA